MNETMAGKGNVGQQAPWRLLAVLLLCLLAFTVPASATDHPLHGHDRMVVAGADYAPDRHAPQTPVCHHDSHHGGVVGLPFDSRPGSEPFSGDGVDGPVTGFPEPVTARGAGFLPGAVAAHSRHAPPLYLLTQRLRL